MSRKMFISLNPDELEQETSTTLNTMKGSRRVWKPAVSDHQDLPRRKATSFPPSKSHASSLWQTNLKSIGNENHSDKGLVVMLPR